MGRKPLLSLLLMKQGYPGPEMGSLSGGTPWRLSVVPGWRQEICPDLWYLSSYEDHPMGNLGYCLSFQWIARKDTMYRLKDQGAKTPFSKTLPDSEGKMMGPFLVLQSSW
jgi:hypothetical protein